MQVEYFKAVKKTNRFNANQKVWIRQNLANSLWIWFRWRGNGRYISGTIDKFSPSVGEIKKIDVSEAFASRIVGASGGAR